jgi:uncharacterized protein (TIGR03382 family)
MKTISFAFGSPPLAVAIALSLAYLLHRRRK